MSLLPNVFSDPKLRARQDQLDAQWKSLKASYDSCSDTPQSSFAEFATDFRDWTNFYDSESDWSADSKTATDEWQVKAASWAGKISSWCASSTAAGVPTVPPPPADEPTLLDKLTSPVTKAEGYLAAFGWGVVGLAVLVVLSIVWIATKGRVKGYGIEAGGK